MFNFIEEITCDTKLYHYDDNKAICPKHHSVMHPQRVKLKYSVKHYGNTSTWDFIVFTCHDCNKLMVNNEKKKWIVHESKKRGITLNIVNNSALADDQKIDNTHGNSTRENKINSDIVTKQRTNNSKRRVTYFDIIVVSNVRYCTNKSHTFEQVLVDVDVVLKDGKIKTQPIFAGYCKQCRKYFMLKSDYKDIVGVPLCEVSDVRKQLVSKSNKSIPYNMQLESKLHKYGYNVSSVNGTTPKQREVVLSYIMENNIMSKTDICSHIDYLINRSRDVMRLQEALSKWECDRRFVRGYMLDNVKHVKANKIHIK